MGQTLSAGSVGAASQWHHLRAGWAAPLPVSPCASLCSLCCSAVAREAGAGRPVRPRHRVSGERRGVFLSDAAERGRGATFDNAPFQIRRKPSKGRRPRPRGAALVLRAVLRHGRASKRVLLVSVFVFARFAREDHTPLGWFVLRHVVYSAAPTTPSSPWLRVDATLLSLQRREKPDPEPIENQRQRPSRSRAARQPRPTRSDREKPNDRVVVGSRQKTNGGSPRAAQKLIEQDVQQARLQRAAAQDPGPRQEARQSCQ